MKNKEIQLNETLKSIKRWENRFHMMTEKIQFDLFIIFAVRLPTTDNEFVMIYRILQIKYFIKSIERMNS